MWTSQWCDATKTGEKIMSCDSYERAADRGPMALGVKIIMLMFAFSIVVGVVGYGLGWFQEAAQVAKEEFGPRAMLQKYEWFKDAAAQLNKKQADIKVYQSRLSSMKSDYEGTKRKDWDRTDKEQFSLWQTEVAGVTASYNGLAAKYNAQMAKFNWRFANAGDLPQGATEPLPREFKP